MPTAIAILAVLLVVLLIDWSKILKKFFPNFNIFGKTANKKTSTKIVRDQNPSIPVEEGFINTNTNEVFSNVNTAQSGVKKHKCSAEVEKILSDADVHFRKGEMKIAEDLYVQAAAKDAKCAKAYSRLGIIYLEHEENLEDAEEAFKQALKIEPTNGYIMNNLGLVLYHRDHFTDAIRFFEQAVRADEHNAGRYANLGMAYMAMRQFAKSESAFKKALKLAPNEAEYKDLLNEAIEKKTAHKTMLRR